MVEDSEGNVIGIELEECLIGFGFWFFEFGFLFIYLFDFVVLFGSFSYVWIKVKD